MSLTQHELEQVEYWIKRLKKHTPEMQAHHGTHEIGGEECQELAKLLQVLRDYDECHEAK